MTDRNYTCVASAMQTSKKQPIKVGDIFITNQGCKIKVIEYKTYDKVIAEFLDSKKHRVTTTVKNLKSGGIKNPYHPCVLGVGFIGVGNFVSKTNNKHTPEYAAWRSMMQRCYSDKFHEKQPTYKNCAVCDEWHNFQVFAEWYTNHEFYGLGYQLDKDLLIDGNKVYSPDTCMLVPKDINVLFTDRAAVRGDYPIGVVFHIRNKTYLASLEVNGKRKHLGTFRNVNDASNAYQKAKKEYVKQKALEWQDRIDERLFNALMAKAS